MRRNFVEVLRSGKVCLKKEYSKLYDLFYGKNEQYEKSLADFVSENFFAYHFRGTCLSLDEFDETYGFHFVEQPQNFDIDYLVSFCEYVYNLILYLQRSCGVEQTKFFCLQQINQVIETIAYTQCHENGFTIFVPKDNAAIAVSELEQIPKEASYKVIAYNHHAMRGDLERKRQTLLWFSDLLEPKRKNLEAVDRNFTSDLFYAFNTFNIRHNNRDCEGSKYKKPIGDLTNKQLEEWYDEVYQMCLLAFMRLEQVERKHCFDALKNKIENIK